MELLHKFIIYLKEHSQFKNLPSLTTSYQQTKHHEYICENCPLLQGIDIFLYQKTIYCVLNYVFHWQGQHVQSQLVLH
jgi:hypothetical protein